MNQENVIHGHSHKPTDRGSSPAEGPSSPMDDSSLFQVDKKLTGVVSAAGGLDIKCVVHYTTRMLFHNIRIFQNTMLQTRNTQNCF